MRRAGWIGAFVFLAGTSGVGLSPARAEDLTGYFELNATDFTTRDTILGTLADDTETQGLNKRFYVSFNRRLFPRLTIWGGGTFDDFDSTTRSRGVEFDTEVRRLTPYLGVRRNTPTQYQQLLWSRDQVRTEFTGGISSETIRDGWFGTFGWRRPSLPSVRLSLSRTHDRDTERRFQDQAASSVDLTVNHEFKAPVRLTYRGALNDNDDRLGRTSVRSQSHSGLVRYDDSWLDRRITLNTEYSVVYREAEVVNLGTGDVVLPLFAVQGLAARDDTPLDGPLIPDGSLIDDERATGGAIDLGLPAPSEDDTPWGLGIELDPDTTVNTLFVWVDRELRLEISSAFVWQVLVSTDNNDWSPREIVSAAPFDPSLHRFEIRFQDVATQFVKVVVAPLASTVPFASDYPDILVTELDAALRTPTETPRTAQNETIQTASASTRVRLLAARDLYYEGSFRGSDSNRRPERWWLSNGISYGQPLNEVYAVTGRIAWIEESRRQGRDQSLVYAGTLTSTPVPRLRTTMALSGQENAGDVSDASDNVSVFFYALAGLYQGVDVQLGIGRAFEDAPNGTSRESTQINASAQIVPNPEWTVGLSYLDTASERFSPEDIARSETFSRAAEINAAFTPFPTLFLYGSERLEWQTDEERHDISNFTLTWTPFPGGTIRIGLNYNETRRSDLDQWQRVFGPSVRWDLNRRSYLQAAYQAVREESEIRRLDNEILTATLRLGF